jgi:hypothetical protein
MFVCKGKRLANYLIENGSTLKRIDCDQKAKGFLVFLFEEDKTIEENLKQWEVDKSTYLF